MPQQRPMPGNRFWKRRRHGRNAGYLRRGLISWEGRHKDTQRRANRMERQQGKRECQHSDT